MSTPEEYILRGTLEAYVLGTASAAERAEVEAMAAKHPEVKAELEAIEKAMEAYATRHAVQPPSHLKNKILDAVSAAPRAAANGKGTVYRMEPNLEKEPRIKGYTSVLAIAASIALVVSLGINYYLYRKVSVNENAITAAAAAEQKIEKQLRDSALAYQGMRNELYVMKDPMFKMVKLNGLKASPQSKAMVCWCPDSKEVYLASESLPAPPNGMQYQLWAIVDGKPVDAGMISMAPGMQKMKLIANASAFAVTLEKAGGSDTPHGDMYVMGTI